MMEGSVDVGFRNSGLLSEHFILSCWLGSKMIVLIERSGFLLAEVEQVKDGLTL